MSPPSIFIDTIALNRGEQSPQTLNSAGKNMGKAFVKNPHLALIKI